MTTARLKQYQALRREIEVLNRAMVEIGARGPNRTSDTVSSAAEWPYNIHHVQIDGLDWAGYSRERERIRQLRETARAHAEAELAEIEGFIAGIEDSELRQIFRCRYIEGLSWLHVARRMGSDATADGCRMRHDRAIKKIS